MNKKGITLIEIIISIVLISIVLILLFSLLISVQDINYESRVNSTYLINKSLMIKNIEEDFDKANTIHLEKCAINEEQFYPGYAEPNEGEYFKKQGSYDENLKANKCIKFIYNSGTIDESNAYLGVYYYKTKEMYVISYVHGSHKSTRTLPEFEEVPANLDSLNNINEKYWKHNNSEINNAYFTANPDLNITDGKFHNIYIPIMGSDGKDYSLNISYYKETP